jgi:hypothetical protein
VQLTAPHARLLTWPNAITARDFERWEGDRARNVPRAFDARYDAILSMRDAADSPVTGTLLTARVGRGTVVFSALSLDAQLERRCRRGAPAGEPALGRGWRQG